jgi:hypothetical protein
VILSCQLKPRLGGLASVMPTFELEGHRAYLSLAVQLAA